MKIMEQIPQDNFQPYGKRRMSVDLAEQDINIGISSR